MPFTVSHTVAILPLNKILRKFRVLDALAIGAMMPDLAYFIPFHLFRGKTHGIPSLITFSLPLGLLVLFFFRILGKEALVSLMPFKLEKPITNREFRRSDILACPAAILLGAATHILWDSFTHGRGFFVEYLPVLGEFYVYKSLQHGGSLVGGLILLGILRKNSNSWFLNRKMLVLLVIPLAHSFVSFFLSLENGYAPTVYRLSRELVFTGGKTFLGLILIYSVFFKARAKWREALAQHRHL